ncbi:unnamed protein product [Soboliphyme baturini]|uniref:Flavin_Reduct domain-containing protein n=1 Tax=Soboliphyme baturini TaxID=241478 RepID=A0A183J3D1_9BILA|nr:unnamed protein product [Soboliphyme baturini]
MLFRYVGRFQLVNVTCPVTNHGSVRNLVHNRCVTCKSVKVPAITTSIIVWLAQSDIVLVGIVRGRTEKAFNVASKKSFFTCHRKFTVVEAEIRLASRLLIRSFDYRPWCFGRRHRRRRRYSRLYVIFMRKFDFLFVSRLVSCPTARSRFPLRDSFSCFFTVVVVARAVVVDVCRRPASRWTDGRRRRWQL